MGRVLFLLLISWYSWNTATDVTAFSFNAPHLQAKIQICPDSVVASRLYPATYEPPDRSLPGRRVGGGTR